MNKVTERTDSETVTYSANDLANLGTVPAGYKIASVELDLAGQQVVVTFIKIT
tara:strand:- start:3023 stop:3181 length:159 start_codon:yes stop_codon:yes gene_type:complete